MQNGLVNFKTNADIEAEEEAARHARQQMQQQRMYEQTIAGQIRKDWESAKRTKEPVERRMLDCLRRRKGEYDETKLAEIREQGGSEIYMQLTATKCRAAYSWIRDVLIPSNEKPWGLTPTPVSDIPLEVQQAIVQEIQMAAQQSIQQGQGQPVDIRSMMKDAIDDLRDRANAAAKEAAKKMELTIEDQLSEGGWNDALDQFIDDFVTFPGSVLKAPVLKKKAVLSWAEGWQAVKTYEVVPHVERVSPFDLYPSQDATDPDDAAFIFERARFTRSDLAAMRGVPGYSEDAINDVLTEYGKGGLRDWLWTDTERAHIEGRHADWLSSDSTIDGLIYYGSALGLSLLQWGVPPSQVDPLEEYQIEGILIGRHLIRLTLHSDPLERRPYGVSSFQKIPGSFWGQSPPELMADIQDTCNATARALINNLAMGSGPMIEINYDRLAPGEDGEIYPWKAFQTKSSKVSGNDAAIRFYQPSLHAAELMGVYEKFEQKADDVTNIPRYMYGSEKIGGAGATMGGLSMLMESANKGIKAAIGHIDKGTIRRVIEGFWMYNMLYNPDRSIKGDCKVIPRGSSAMLMRERTQMMRNQFLQSTANPMDSQIVGNKNRARILSTIARELDINDLDDLEDMAEQAGKANSESAQLQQIIQQLEQADRQSKIDERNAKAQKTLAEAHSQPLENEKLIAEVKLLIQQLARNQEATNATNPATARSNVAHQAVTGLTGIPRIPREQPREPEGRSDLHEQYGRSENNAGAMPSPAGSY
jgi:hypothetical protein